VTALPRPIPHPLDHGPFDVPRWAREALQWVIGDDWPLGDEAATWQVADRWFAVASALDAPHEAAFAAAAQIMSGPDSPGFHDAWQRLAGDSSAPLNSLIAIAAELGDLVEQCGHDLEAAKLEAWIELGLFLIDLLGMRAALGAASPAASGLIAATRLNIQLIFERLATQLAAAPASEASHAAAGAPAAALATVSGPAVVSAPANVPAPAPASFQEAETHRLFPRSGPTSPDRRTFGATPTAQPQRANRAAASPGRDRPAAPASERAASADHGRRPAAAAQHGASPDRSKPATAAPQHGTSPDRGRPATASQQASPTDRALQATASPQHAVSDDRGRPASAPQHATSDDRGKPATASRRGGSADRDRPATNAPQHSAAADRGRPATNAPQHGAAADRGKPATNAPHHGASAQRGAPGDEGATQRLEGRGISAAGVLRHSRGATATPASGATATPPSGPTPTPAAAVTTPAGADGAATRRIPQSELERIARSAREPANVGLGTRMVKLPSGSRPPVPKKADSGPVLEKFGYATDVQQHEYSVFLSTVADETRARSHAIGELADQEILTGSTRRGDELRARSTELRALLAQIEKAAAQVAAGYLRPAVVLSPAAADAEPPVPEVVTPAKDERSALNGSLPIDLTRRYDTYGGLRAPYPVQQQVLKDAVPQDGDGRALRLADPRAGRWFELANAGGPGADPARGLNCVDGVLALFDTYLHGRPRVAAPRTFDSYAAGDPDRPVGGEWHGLRRIELATGTTFQNLCPFQGGADPDAARSAVDAAMRNLSNHLHNSGHGSFAFILTDLEGGGCHAWAAVNHDDTILFLDPQIGRISEDAPLYRHTGAPSAGNVASMDALVVDGKGIAAPLPYHGAGQWSGASAA
jgi:hypothetical protein